MAWTDSLQNASTKAAVIDYSSDNFVSYSEMLTLLSAFAPGGVSASEYADLKLIDNNFSSLYASEYLRKISNYFVFENPANDKWWGGSVFAADVSTLGNLSANFSEDSTNKLIGKWFLGTDLPMPISGGDSATGTVGNFSFSYAKASGPLFVSGPAASDVTQGYAGSCYLVATLGAIANANPSLINGMFIDNQNDTYGVRFYGTGGVVYTTVNESLPVHPNNSIAFSGNATKSLNGELWVSLAEKAYAQINAQDGALADNDKSGVNSYQAIEGGFAQPIKQIANQNYKYYSSYYTGIPDSLDSGEFYSANSSTYKQTIINGLNAGGIGWLGSWGESSGANGKKNFVAGHAYMLLGYNSATDKFIVRNPWGGDGTSSSHNPQFEVSIEEFWNSTIKGLVALSDPTTATPVYSYSLTNNASNTGTAVAEGSPVTVTITRNTSGSADTVFLSTKAGSASEGDYAALAKLAVSFDAYETSKTVSIGTYWDTASESTESFQVELFKASADSVASASTTAFIKDGAAVNFEYAIATSADTGNPVTEGSGVTFTITRNSSGSASTVYLRTALGTASANDYAVLNQQAVNFAAYETSKTVQVATYQDSVPEGTEFFYLGLYKNFSDSLEQYATYSWGHIKDAPVSNYSYSVSSLADAANPVSEGGKATFTVTRSSSGSTSTVYVSTVPGTASASDYSEINKQAITFAPYETSKTVTVDILQDWWTEGGEYFYLGLYKNFTDGFYDYATYGTAHVTDTAVSTFNYTVSSNATASAAVNEGGNVIFTINRNGSGSASTVYVSTSAGSADVSDFASIEKYAVNFAAYETSKTVTVNTFSDSLSEGDEYFWLDLYKNLSDQTWSTYGSATIRNVAAADYSYAVASNAPSGSPVTEGGQVSFTITRSGSGSASTVYVSTSEGSADWSDYAEYSRFAVNFAAFETAKTITVNTYVDVLNEGSEYFWLDVFKNIGDTTPVSYGSAYLRDAVSNDYSYAVSSSANSNPVTEGGSVVFTITRSGSGTASTVYVSTSEGSAGWSDFSDIDRMAVNFLAGETIKTVSVATFADSLIEGEEYFWLDLYKNYGDFEWSSYGSAFIKDVAVVDYTYSISSSAASGSPVTEGGKVSFTISRNGAGTASTVYVSTSDGSADWADYAGLSNQAVSFAVGESSKTITVDTYTDSVIEGEEYFWLDLYKNPGDTSWSTYASAHLKDAPVGQNFTYSITSNALSENAVSEGATVNFTITRSSSGSSSTVYVNTQDGTASSADYSGLFQLPVYFSANETSKVISVNAIKDLATEDPEYFYLTLYKNISDSNYASWGYAYIKDAPATDYSYAVTSNSSSTNPISEGSAAVFTITRNTSGSASTVYVSTSHNSTSSSDFTALSKYAVNFAANETTKTVSVQTAGDGLSEGVEAFWLDLYKSANDANWATYGSGYIKDAPAANYSYTVTSNSSSANPIAEGSAASFTITRSATGSASTVYLSTSHGNTSNSDFTAIYMQALNFGANETSKSVSIQTTIDNNSSEGTEYFWLDLYKTQTDTTWSTYGTAYINGA